MDKRVILMHVLSVRNTFLAFMMGVFAALLFGSCTEQSLVYVSENEASVLIGIATGRASERKASYEGNTRIGADEYDVKSAVVLIYNANKLLEKSGVLGADGMLQLTLREGKKYIYVIANPSASLKSQLDALPAYTQLNDMVSLANDYNAGNYPIQGLLMTGSIEETVSADQTNAITVPLTMCTARVDLYINKGGSDVEDLSLSSVKLKNARIAGYLFQDKNLAGSATNTVGLLTNKITSVTADGTLTGTQYTYPAKDATDISFEVVVKHANASATDTYTVYLNASNNNSAATLQKGCHYKVLITFSKDESGTVVVSGYTSKTNDFTIG